MPKIQDVLDKTLPALGVIINGDYLREPGVFIFFEVVKYRHYPSGKDTSTILEEIKTCATYPIWCSIADDSLPFGPTLLVQGEGQPGKITIPWQYIIAIV